MSKSALPRMVRPALLALTMALPTVGIPRQAAAQDIMSSVSDKHMESVLNDMDIEFSKGKSEHSWRVKLAGYNALLIMANDNTDAQLYIAFGDKTVGAGKMNEWNKTKRFARAYSDDDSNPALESDLDFAGGVTDDAIKAWIKLYETSVTSFVKYLNN
ncbi:MAG: YbjN domain-containing protein [Gemmatimonadota bacterium]|nr:YbjN domain-containing protein [Gemmatimonadota bacterium]MDH4347189.1 YbjN domain-containing protein [Gemmatimonadota bacterium]MDH5284236.1 YbjN domain-containing protein [Gemmatimonadota bacterium]